MRLVEKAAATSIRVIVSIVAVTTVALSPVALGRVHDAFAVTPVVSFVPPEFPESIAIDGEANIYVSIYGTGEVKKITVDRTVSTLAVLGIGPTAFPGRRLAGLAVDATNTVYAALNDVPETHGVWRISQMGEATLFAQLPVDAGLNGLAFDRGGVLYVSDSTGGRIFRVAPNGVTSVWSSDPLLAGLNPSACGTFPAGALGANGISFNKRGDLLVAITTMGAVVHIPVAKDGTAGIPNYLVGPTCDLWGSDGTAVDVNDNLYVAVNIQRKIVRIDPNGNLETLAAYPAEPLNGPSAVAFGTAPGTRKQTFISNFAPPALGGGTPGVVTMRGRIPGLPVR
jgi:sugar lactone lactonase YvrE